MRPCQRSGTAHARLIAVQHADLLQRLLEAQLDRLQRLGCLLDPGYQRAQREQHPEQINQQGAHPGVGHQLLLDQIDGQRPQPRPLLRPAGCLAWKGPHTHCMAGAALDVQRLMLGDAPPPRRRRME
jgi:hypothetical protein